METFTWRSKFGQWWLHLLTPRDRKNNGMPHMAWHCIALRRVALHLLHGICVGQFAVTEIDRTLWLWQNSIGYGSCRLHGMVWDSIVDGVGIQPPPVKAVMIRECIRMGRLCQTLEERNRRPVYYHHALTHSQVKWMKG